MSSQIGSPHRMPRVSALIVNYRTYAELDACLRALRDQPHLESVVVVDQASVPDQRTALAGRHPSVVWLARDDNLGFGAGVNLAARHASGDYLYLINPDATVKGDAIGVLARWLEANPSVGVAGSMVHNSDGTVQGSARSFPSMSTLFAGRSSWLTRRFPDNRWSRRNVLSGPDVTTAVTVDWVSGASMMIRRAAFDEVGGFDERFFLYWEDADFCRRLRTGGWLTAYVPEAAVVHHGGRSAGSDLRPLVAFHSSAFRYHLTHSGRLGRAASPLVAVILGLRLAWKMVIRRLPEAP